MLKDDCFAVEVLPDATLVVDDGLSVLLVDDGKKNDNATVAADR